MKRLVLVLPLLAFVPTSTAAAADAVAEQPTDARSLLEKMSTVSGLEARFVEKKKLALLKAPLVSEGRIYYTRGGYMARVIEKPVASTVRIGPTKDRAAAEAALKSVKASVPGAAVVAHP